MPMEAKPCFALLYDQNWHALAGPTPIIEAVTPRNSPANPSYLTICDKIRSTRMFLIAVETPADCCRVLTTSSQFVDTAAAVPPRSPAKK